MGRICVPAQHWARALTPSEWNSGLWEKGGWNEVTEAPPNTGLGAPGSIHTEDRPWVRTVSMWPSASQEGARQNPDARPTSDFQPPELGENHHPVDGVWSMVLVMAAQAEQDRLYVTFLGSPGVSVRTGTQGSGSGQGCVCTPVSACWPFWK